MILLKHSSFFSIHTTDWTIRFLEWCTATSLSLDIILLLLKLLLLYGLFNFLSECHLRRLNLRIVCIFLLPHDPQVGVRLALTSSSNAAKHFKFTSSWLWNCDADDPTCVAAAWLPITLRFRYVKMLLLKWRWIIFHREQSGVNCS